MTKNKKKNRKASPVRPKRPARPSIKDLLGLVLAAFAFFVLLGLGFWQLERKSWKEGLIAELTANSEGPPLQLAELLRAAQEDALRAEDAYRPLALEGEFLPSHGIFLLGRSYRGQSGAHLFMLLKLGGTQGSEAPGEGPLIFVNRGWVPLLGEEEKARLLARLGGWQQTEGLLRLAARAGEGRSQPVNEPARDLWLWPDLEAFAARLGLDGVITSFYLDEALGQHPGPYPIGGQTVISLPNPHLHYAITWFSLAFILVLMVWAYSRKQRGGS